jgi:hypothetical protein
VIEADAGAPDYPAFWHLAVEICVDPHLAP